VDIASGMVFTDGVDFEWPGSIPLKWERTWYSTSDYQGPLGHGWHHAYDQSIELRTDAEEIVVRQEDGRQLVFPLIEVGEQTFSRQEQKMLYRDVDQIRIEDADGLVHYFQPRGGEGAFRLTRIEDATGFNLSFRYNENRHLSEIQDSAARRLRLENDANGRITALYGPHPQKAGEEFCMVSYRYDAAGNLIEVQDALDQSMRFQYDGHLLVRETNRNNLSFYFEYEGEGTEAKCVHTWGDNDIFLNHLTYLEGLTIVENSLGHRTQYYHEGGLVCKTIDALGNTTYTEYGEDNEVLAEINGLGEQRTYAYDGSKNVVQIVEPDGSTIQIQYDGKRLAGATDAVGGAWEWKYNEQGQLVERTDSLGRKTAYAYENGLLRMITDPAGGQTFLTYNKQHNLTQLITPDGQASFWTYDELGRVVSAIDPKGNVQKRTYDLQGRLRKLEEPDGNIRRLEYDGEGNVVQAEDLQHDVRFQYGNYNRMTARIEAGARVSFDYDTEGQLVAIRNEKGHEYRFELDSNGDVITEIGFDGLRRKYSRDAAGRVSQVDRPGGLYTRYEYDELGRVTQVLHSDGTGESYTYREDGELIAAENDATTIHFERDLLGQVIKENQGGYELLSNFNELGMRTGLRSTLGANLSFVRNAMGDVEKVTANGMGKPWEAIFRRDEVGLELERLLPGQVSSRWLRDRLGRPVKQETSVGGAATRIRTYKWDLNDRLKEIIDGKLGATTFEHDIFGNLAAARYPDGSTEYRWPDEVGNLFRQKDRKDREYGPAGQLLRAGKTRYEYDAEGNLIRKTEAGGQVWEYEWNAAGMLQRVIRPDRNTVSFAYDALGRRIAKTYLGKTTRWVWDGNVPLHEWIMPAEDFSLPVEARLQPQPESGEAPGGYPPEPKDVEVQPSSSGVQFDQDLKDERLPTSDFRLPTSLTTWVFEPESFAPLAKLQDERQYGIITDHLGTPVAMMDEEGDKVWGADTSIYGELRNSQGETQACPFRYPGQYQDVETGLYYNRFRYYAPESGVYLSQDPIRMLGGLESYSYVNNPLKLIDPVGLSQCNLKKFSQGATHITTTKRLKRFPDSPTYGGKDFFVAPTDEIDDLLAKNPSRRDLEKALGLENGALEGGDLVRIDVAPSSMKNLRMPSGKEATVNSKFLKGGKTSGGVSEAIIDGVPKNDPGVTCKIIKVIK
jgi:RHS repeat-associated protein